MTAAPHHRRAASDRERGFGGHAGASGGLGVMLSPSEVRAKHLSAPTKTKPFSEKGSVALRGKRCFGRASRALSMTARSRSTKPSDGDGLRRPAGQEMLRARFPHPQHDHAFTQHETLGRRRAPWPCRARGASGGPPPRPQHDRAVRHDEALRDGRASCTAGAALGSPSCKRFALPQLVQHRDRDHHLELAGLDRRLARRRRLHLTGREGNRRRKSGDRLAHAHHIA